MKPFICVKDGITRDYNKRKFDYFICFEDDKPDEYTELSQDKFFVANGFEEFIRLHRPYGLRVRAETQEELDYFIDKIHPFVVSLDLVLKHSRSFDLTPLEKCSKLEAIQFYWNTKQDTLWDIKKNPNLKYFEMTDYYKISDCSSFCGSSIEVLKLFGCNSLSSFVSKMRIEDLSFILKMPNLRELYLDIIKDKSSEYYLDLFSKCANLRVLSNPGGFFTFQQFAWLKAHLPNVQWGLHCVWKHQDFAQIIGKRMPRFLTEPKKIAEYQKRYDALVDKYKSVDEPPNDDDNFMPAV